MRRIGFLAALAVVLVLVPGIASAAGASSAKLWLECSGSWNTYSMGDVNGDIALVNAELAGTGFSVDKIRDGYGLGVRTGMDLPLLTLGVGYERLFAATDWSYRGVGLQYRFPANAVFALAEMRLPSSGRAGARLGLAGGLVSLAPVSRVGVTGGEDPFSYRLTGTGALLEVYGAGEWWMTPQVALVGAAGYRHASVKDPTVDDTWTRSDYAIEYGGLHLRAGIKLGLVK